MAYSGIKIGTFYPDGGFGKVIDGFVNLCKEQGVRFITNTNVERININKSKAKNFSEFYHFAKNEQNIELMMLTEQLSVFTLLYAFVPEKKFDPFLSTEEVFFVVKYLLGEMNAIIEDLRSYRVDFSKLEKILNFKLEKSLEDAIKELIFSLRNNIYPDPNNSKYKN